MVILYYMKRPIYVRPLSDAERKTLKAGLRSSDASFCAVVKSCLRVPLAKMLTKSLLSWAATLKPCATPSTSSTRKVLTRHSSRVRAARTLFIELLDEKRAEALRALLHQEPRKFGKDTSLWTLDLAAEVSFEE